MRTPKKMGDNCVTHSSRIVSSSSFVPGSRLIFLGVSVLLLGACATNPFTSAVPSGKVRLRDLGALALTEDSLPKIIGSSNVGTGRRIQVGDAWQWRGRDANGAPMQSFVSPVPLDGGDALIATLGGGLQRVDLASGRVRWSLALPIGVASRPAVAGGSAIVAGMDGKLRRLRLMTGAQEWQTTLSSESLGGCLVAEGIAYVNTADDALFAVDEKTGSVLWSYRRPSSSSSVLWSLRGASLPQLSPDGKKLYLGFSDGVFVALEAVSGQTAWERSFERPGRFKDADQPFALSKDGKMLYLPLVDGDLVALDTQNGAPLWKLPGGGGAPPFLDEKDAALYVGTLDGQVQKLSAAGGHVLWSFSLGGKRGPMTGAADLGAYVVVNTTESGFVILDKKDGRLELDKYLGRGLLAAPYFDGRRLFVLNPRNLLYRYRVEFL